MTITIYIGNHRYKFAHYTSQRLSTFSILSQYLQTPPDPVRHPKIRMETPFDFRGTKTVHYFCAQTWHWFQRLK